LEGIRLGEMDERGGRHTGAAPEIVNREERLVCPRTDDGGGMRVGETLDHAKPEPDGEATFVVGRLKRTIPPRGIDANGANFDAVVAGVPDDLRGRIKAHRLRIK
jgi:hypothetical protein